MNKITKNNIGEFFEYYHRFHDSYITNVNYSIIESKIELFIDVFWSGEPVLKEDNTYETNKTKIKMVFTGIERCNNKELFYADEITEGFMKYIQLDNKEFICFADDEINPRIYIVSDSVEYEDLKEKW